MAKPLEKFTRLASMESTVLDMIQKLNYIFENLSISTDAVDIPNGSITLSKLDVGYNSSQINSGTIPVLDLLSLFSSSYIEGALNELGSDIVAIYAILNDNVDIEHQQIEVAAHGLGVNRPTEASVGTVFGWQVAKTKEFYLSDGVSEMRTGDGPGGASTFEFHLLAICNNTSADKEVEFTLNYLCADNDGTVLGGAGTPLTTKVTVPTTPYECFKVAFQIPKADFIDKPYITARITRNAIAGDPDPDTDPIIFKACLLYDIYKF